VVAKTSSFLIRHERERTRTRKRKKVAVAMKVTRKLNEWRVGRKRMMLT